MLIEIGQKAKETSYILGKMGTDLKNAGLLAAAQEILDEEDEILKANAADVAKAKERGMAPGLVDRLELNHKRIEGIVEGMRQVVGLEDPVGEVISMKRRPNGLLIGQKRVPFGVIGIIYEARPNVTADAFALCFKTGNAVILRGGSDALESNKAIVTAIRNGLKKEGIPEDGALVLEGRVLTREMLGSETLYKVETEVGPVQAKVFDEHAGCSGTVTLVASGDNLHWFDQKEARI